LPRRYIYYHTRATAWIASRHVFFGAPSRTQLFFQDFLTSGRAGFPRASSGRVFWPWFGFVCVELDVFYSTGDSDIVCVCARFAGAAMRARQSQSSLCSLCAALQRRWRRCGALECVFSLCSERVLNVCKRCGFSHR